MKYDLYFHNDFDGRASAAVMLAFLRSRGDSVARYFSMTYGFEGEWLAKDLLHGKNPAIVVDFLYHPGAAWWFDHHPTAFRKTQWKKTFKPDDHHRYDPSAKSACHVVYTSLKKDFGWKPPRHLSELVKWLDIFDSAGYRSAKETLDMKPPACQINAFVEARKHTKEEDRLLIEVLAAQPLARVVKVPRIARVIRIMQKKVSTSIVFYKEHLQIFKNNTLIDFTKDPLGGFLRFVPYYLYPDRLYHVRMRKKGEGVWYVGVGANPWHRTKNRLALGAMMKRKFNGGGHDNAGAAEFRTKAEAMRAFEQINAILDR